MKYVTHFSVQMDNEPLRRGNYLTYAYLNTSSLRRIPFSPEHWEQDQARILVCQGSEEKCEQFVADITFLDEAFQWVGYLVAGGIGAILTLIFQNLRT